MSGPLPQEMEDLPARWTEIDQRRWDDDPTLHEEDDR